ncbi:MAG: glutamine amidotransferase, partial [Synergistaceae bacterium]|nr:glutamine amidotransferase [Synergistaceae bacterium]
RTEAVEDALVAATVNGDPFIALRRVEKGRTAAFSSDCAPHWGPPEFLNWSGYGRFWNNLVAWLTS